MADTSSEAKWYVAHTYSGYENKVKVDIEKTIENRNLQDQIFEVSVPVQSTVELKNGVEKKIDKKIFPGYVLVHMIMNEDNWYIVRNTRGVTGFVGSEPTKPVPLSEEEMLNLGVKAPVTEVDFEVGDSVRVTNGVWVNTIGEVREIDESRRTVKISIPEFMNGAPVSMDFADVAKLN